MKHASAVHAEGDRTRAPREADAPQAAEASVWGALKALGGAAKALVAALARCVLAVWRPIPVWVRRLLIWVGIPAAAAIFGTSVAYHLLGFHLESQAQTIRKAKTQLVAAQAKLRSLEEELKGSLATAEKYREEGRKAGDDAKRAVEEAGKAGEDAVAARAELAKLRQEHAALRSGLVTTAGSQPAARTSKKALSMPCDLRGPSAGYEAKLTECVAQFNKLNER